ncbi:hypothetical protein RchiOBHm_Chr4g0432061 [Rosa chinensis]|uniref:Uncharacterized protein n=1 Tax=Rosa chinensis TaxID=74649 RepID=A0A2P6R0W3_ROSCH|nr:hypothetical protein RchiOBHm_Chr4g0432061 [Rosa chinensis]
MVAHNTFSSYLGYAAPIDESGKDLVHYVGSQIAIVPSKDDILYTQVDSNHKDHMVLSRVGHLHIHSTMIESSLQPKTNAATRNGFSETENDKDRKLEVLSRDDVSPNTIGKGGSKKRKFDSPGVAENIFNSVATSIEQVQTQPQFDYGQDTMDQAYIQHFMLTKATNKIAKKLTFQDLCAYDESAYFNGFTSVLNVQDATEPKTSKATVRKSEWDSTMNKELGLRKQGISYWSNEVFLCKEKYAKDLIHRTGMATSRAGMLSIFMLLEKECKGMICCYFNMFLLLSILKIFLPKVSTSFVFSIPCSNLIVLTPTEIEGRC